MPEICAAVKSSAKTYFIPKECAVAHCFPVNRLRRKTQLLSTGGGFVAWEIVVRDRPHSPCAGSVTRRPRPLLTS
ncbi:hypothetical protein BaRGS_00028067, partial [Batillaria attramentaria]